MCSICGILGGSCTDVEGTIGVMSAVMKNRGPDQSGTYISQNVAFGQNRLAIIDIEHGIQPMTREFQGHKYTIIYNGELYNTPELTKLINDRGITPLTHCDTEVVLYLYILFGRDCAAMLNGIFAFAVHDMRLGEVYLARDRFGIKPLFYAQVKGALVFASEIKALLRYPGVRPVIDQKGFWELIFLSPVRLDGGVYKGICELAPAHYASWSDGKLQLSRYWTLQAQECIDSREEIILRTRELLSDAIERQLVSDVPLCTLLSGGLDSSVISSVAAAYYKNRGQRLATYSFEYEGNRTNFKSSLFQPNSDDEYAQSMAAWLDTEHHVLTAPNDTIVELLGTSALARDFPGQADIDSSLLYFCRRIKENHTVAISGECADEIFGGYPWFYRPEMLESSFFPWIHKPQLRASLFEDTIAKSEEGFMYLCEQFRKSREGCPTLDSDSAVMKTSRLSTWISVNYFMSSLLERKDRMSMAASVEVRVPYADHRILEYVFNVPWEIKFENQTEKALLRNAMGYCLPEEILHRKKSPYPKTQDPQYEDAVLRALLERLKRGASALAGMLNRRALDEFRSTQSRTWFGQLMGRPQLLAWLLQFDIWAEAYNVDFEL